MFEIRSVVFNLVVTGMATYYFYKGSNYIQKFPSVAILTLVVGYNDSIDILDILGTNLETKVDDRAVRTFISSCMNCNWNCLAVVIVVDAVSILMLVQFMLCSDVCWYVIHVSMTFTIVPV